MIEFQQHGALRRLLDDGGKARVTFGVNRTSVVVRRDDPGYQPVSTELMVSALIALMAPPPERVSGDEWTSIAWGDAALQAALRSAGSATKLDSLVVLDEIGAASRSHGPCRPIQGEKRGAACMKPEDVVVMITERLVALRDATLQARDDVQLKDAAELALLFRCIDGDGQNVGTTPARAVCDDTQHAGELPNGADSAAAGRTLLWEECIDPADYIDPADRIDLLDPDGKK